jgi:imidazolonepropionase-like amidohydrolase
LDRVGIAVARPAVNEGAATRRAGREVAPRRGRAQPLVKKYQRGHLVRRRPAPRTFEPVLAGPHQQSSGRHISQKIISVKTVSITATIPIAAALFLKFRVTEVCSRSADGVMKLPSKRLEQMRKPFALALIILLRAGLAAQVERGAAPPSPLAFNHVTVVDVKGGRLEPDMTVIVVGNRIAAVGKSSRTRIPEHARVVDAGGKFLIPGLWDMHAHLGEDDFDKRSYLSLFIANGVTGVRIMEGAPEHHAWREEIRGGKLTGPRLVIASRMIGSGDLSNISAASAREEVRKAKRDGADFIKVHDNVPRASYFALIDEAKRLNLPVEGHVPGSITAAEASDAGQKSIEHFTGLDDAKSDAGKADALIAVFKRNRTWLCPTLVMRSNYASLDDAGFARDPRLKYVKPSWKNRWLSMTKAAADTPAAEWAKRRELIRRDKALVAKMQRAGVNVLAGTDDSNPYSFVGFGLHDELALLVDGGLSPLEALRAATLNPAKFFNRPDSLGTVEKGKLADLVLLDADPLEDIRNTTRINAVVADGRYFPTEALQQILAEAEAAAEGR